mgnify:CR=1 FL=1
MGVVHDDAERLAPVHAFHAARDAVHARETATHGGGVQSERLSERNDREAALYEMPLAR